MIFKLSGYKVSFLSGLTELGFASSFKSFGVAMESVAFKCACKIKRAPKYFFLTYFFCSRSTNKNNEA